MPSLEKEFGAHKANCKSTSHDGCCYYFDLFLLNHPFFVSDLGLVKWLARLFECLSLSYGELGSLSHIIISPVSCFAHDFGDTSIGNHLPEHFFCLAQVQQTVVVFAHLQLQKRHVLQRDCEAVVLPVQVCLVLDHPIFEQLNQPGNMGVGLDALITS